MKPKHLFVGLDTTGHAGRRPLSQGGAMWDMRNLAPSCGRCQLEQGGKLGALASGWVKPDADELPPRRCRRRRRVHYGAIGPPDSL